MKSIYKGFPFNERWERLLIRKAIREASEWGEKTKPCKPNTSGVDRTKYIR